MSQTLYALQFGCALRIPFPWWMNCIFTYKLVIYAMRNIYLIITKKLSLCHKL